MVVYPLLYINITIYVYIMLTFKCLNLLSISATLACIVGLFQRTCLPIHPAAFTPELVHVAKSLYCCLYTHIFVIYLYVV